MAHVASNIDKTNFSGATKKHCIKSQVEQSNAEWLKEVELKLENVNIQETVEIKEDVTMQLRKTPNWKTPGLDRIQGLCLKRFTSQHLRLTEELNDNIQPHSNLSRLMKSRTVLIKKDPAKGNAVGNYQPIACLNLLWKLKTGIIDDKFYQHLESENLLLDEQKGCRHASRNTKDQLLMDKAVIRNCKRRETNLNMAWINFRKAYDMVPHAWIIKALKLIGAAPNVIALLKSTMTGWKTELISGDINLSKVNIS